MSVLIKGMEMPKGCNDCMFAEYFEIADEGSGYRQDATLCIFNRKECEEGELFDDFRFEHCPLVELPEKHGNLIDSKEIQLPLMESKADEVWTKVAIDSTPTVIEAEGE